MSSENPSPTYKVNMENEEELRKAIALLEAKLKSKKPDVKTREELEAELEDLREKLSIVAEREFERKISQLESEYGITLSEEQKSRLYESPEALSTFEQLMRENYRKMQAQVKTQKAPEGVTPLTPRQYGYEPKPLEKQEFPDYSSMIQAIREQDRTDILNQLYQKAISGMKQAEKPIVYTEPKEAPSIKEQLDYKYFYENIAPKLKAKGLSDAEIDAVFQSRHKKKSKDDLRFKTEPVK